MWLFLLFLLLLLAIAYLSLWTRASTGPCPSAVQPSRYLVIRDGQHHKDRVWLVGCLVNNRLYCTGERESQWTEPPCYLCTMVAHRYVIIARERETFRETYWEIKPTAHHSDCDEGAFIFIWKLRRQSILILSMANHFPITRVQLDE